MKVFPAIVFLALAAAIAVPGQTGDAIWIGPLYPTITFSESSDSAVVRGAPTVIDTVQLMYSCTCGSQIVLTEIRGDSLIFELGTGASGNKIVFNNEGVYKAYERTVFPCFNPPCPETLVYRGTFRVLPKVEVSPAIPTTEDSVSIIFLTFIPDTDVYCTRMYVEEPIAYGPVFSLGWLPAGSYYLRIEDSIAVGRLTVNNPVIVNGHVQLMIHPFIDMVPPSIAGVEIIALPAPYCDWYSLYGAERETLRTVSDALGNFTLTLPHTGTDYEITALGSGYYPQTMYLNNYPLSKSLPPQVFLTYDLIADTDTALGGCDIIVTNSTGAPVESAYVSITGGREILDCAMLAKAAAGAADLYAPITFAGYTDRQGKVSFRDASLSTCKASGTSSG
jgi:hypothetical protein